MEGTMRKSDLPSDLIDLGRKYGFGGKLVYIPKENPQNLVAQYTPIVLEKIEGIYESEGIIFYDRSRRSFSERINQRKVAEEFKLKPRTAARVILAAYKTWRNWFGHHERLKLEQLVSIAEEAGAGYTPLYYSYLEIRGKVRRNQKPDIYEYSAYHSISEETVQQIIDLAKSSVESCSWRAL